MWFHYVQLKSYMYIKVHITKSENKFLLYEW
jgi:hypothetical protein